ncbi:Uncharacterised protein [Segatella copri]|nr:Uncharacterised protein [Segatella copri]
MITRKNGSIFSCLALLPHNSSSKIFSPQYLICRNLQVCHFAIVNRNPYTAIFCKQHLKIH